MIPIRTPREDGDSPRRAHRGRRIFDAPFFGVSTREAVFMDPQHRLLLETTWQAVEHSNTAPSTLAGTKTGVFIGISTTDYLTLLTNAMTVEDIDAYLAIGNASAAAAGRISYRLGLVGPSVSVDTACSSSWWRCTRRARRCGCGSVIWP